MWRQALTVAGIGQAIQGAVTQNGVLEEGIATDAEALAYVSNASLAVPLASDWAEIYQYLLTRAMKEKIPEELRTENLDNYRMGLLKELQQWLWQKRAKYSEERRRAERAEAKAKIQAKAPKQLGLGF